ncbi:MAG: YbhB/YbcL family Raf kinase inhibitor-like protein [Candidatus Omnitrophota bacterium]|nr:YbhB/YbcL family Raf kinase inhibitor-like protein [Candidatus Omnitrophota bacterium]
MRCLLILLMLLFAHPGWALEISSEDFADGDVLDPRYTCQDEDASPDFSWSHVPEGVKSFVLICEDISTQPRYFAHWVMFNIPADKITLLDNVPKVSGLDDGSKQGLNDFNRYGYSGPCPPLGQTHKYFFRLYALDSRLALESNSRREDVTKAMTGHIIAEAATYCLYSR